MGGPLEPGGERQESGAPRSLGVNCRSWWVHHWCLGVNTSRWGGWTPGAGGVDSGAGVDSWGWRVDPWSRVDPRCWWVDHWCRGWTPGAGGWTLEEAGDAPQRAWWVDHPVLVVDPGAGAWGAAEGGAWGPLRVQATGRHRWQAGLLVGARQRLW